MILFAKESLFEVVDEMPRLLERHKAECVFDHGRFPVDLKWGLYANMERLGNLSVYTARDDGRLVGYCWMVVDTHMHSQAQLASHCELIYLDSMSRLGATGIRFIRFVEGDLQRRGVIKVFWAIKPQKDITKIMYRIGYGLEETVVSKFLN